MTEFGNAHPYFSLLSTKKAEESKQLKKESSLALLRLLVFVVFVCVLLCPLFLKQGDIWWLLFPLAVVLIVLGVKLEKAQNDLSFIRAVIEFFERGLLRLDEKTSAWKTDPKGFDFSNVPALLHKYNEIESGLARDLDLVGPYSLLKKISRAHLPKGTLLLLDWLLKPSEIDVVKTRQTAIKQLTEKNRERAEIYAYTRNLVKLAEIKTLFDIPKVPSKGFVSLTYLSSFFLIGALLMWGIGNQPALVLPSFLIHVIVYFWTRDFTAKALFLLQVEELSFSRLKEPVLGLGQLLSAFGKTETSLDSIQELLSGVETKKAVRSLERYVQVLDSCRNIIVAFTLAPILLTHFHVALCFCAWAKRNQVMVSKWVDAIAELEALSSVASFAAESRHLVFPELVESTSYHCEELVHPMIPLSLARANDFESRETVKRQEGDLVLLSGSNMSGKSTWLRSVGLSVVMAQAGFPVTAKKLRVGKLQVLTSIRVDDALSLGWSHFYAELVRLKNIMDVVSSPNEPAKRPLVLLDELFHGTNSKERVAGAKWVIKKLIEQGAMGFVSTHDLAIQEVETELPKNSFRSFHFGEDLVDGTFSFRYQLEPGPLKTTNALRLMRNLGLDVPSD